MDASTSTKSVIKWATPTVQCVVQHKYWNNSSKEKDLKIGDNMSKMGKKISYEAIGKTKTFLGKKNIGPL